MSHISNLTAELLDVAADIQADFGGRSAYYAAKPYVEALVLIAEGRMEPNHDSLEEVLLRLTGNLRSWRGITARVTKARLQILTAQAKAARL